MKSIGYTKEHFYSKISKIMLMVKRVTSSTFEEFENFDVEQIEPLLKAYNGMIPNNPYQPAFKGMKDGSYFLTMYSGKAYLSMTTTSLTELVDKIRRQLLEQSEVAKESYTQGEKDLVFDLYTLDHLPCNGISTSGFHYYDIARNKYTLSFFELRVMTPTGDYITNGVRM